MAKVKTYNSKDIIIALGTHAVSGLADDSFVTIEAKGEGVKSKSGCDGEVARAVDPNGQYNIKLSLLQMSDTNKFLSAMANKDAENGEGTFPVLIKDIKGGMVFTAESAWVVKAPSRGYGKDTTNREWNIETGPADLTDE